MLISPSILNLQHKKKSLNGQNSSKQNSKPSSPPFNAN